MWMLRIFFFVLCSSVAVTPPLPLAEPGKLGRNAGLKRHLLTLDIRNTTSVVTQVSFESKTAMRVVAGCFLMSLLLTGVLWIALRPVAAPRAHGIIGGPSITSTSRPHVGNVFQIWALSSLNFAYGFTAAVQGLLMMPLEAQHLFADHSSLVVGFCAMLVGIAYLVGPEAGHWSDTYRSTWGRRRPMVIISVAMLSTLTFGLWLTSALGWRCLYLVTFFLQQVTWNAVNAAQAGLIPDLVSAARQGFAGGANAANLLLGATSGFLSMKVMSFYHWDYHVMYAPLAVLTIVCCTIVCMVASEESTALKTMRYDESAPRKSFLQNYMFDVHEHPSFFMLLLIKILYSSAMVVKTFLLFFCQDTFRSGRVEDDELLISNVALAAEVAAVIAAVVTMALQSSESEKGGVRAQLAVCFGTAWMGWMWFGPAYLSFSRASGAVDKEAGTWMAWMVGGTSLWGVGQGIYLAGDQALSLVSLPDQSQASRFLGLTSCCNCAGGVLGGIISGSLLAYFGSGAPKGRHYAAFGYEALFVFAAMTSFVMASLASRIHLNPSPKKLAEF